MPFNMVYIFSSQAEHNEMVPIQSDDSDGGGDEEHVTGGGAKQGEKNREERPGEVQIRKRE